MQTSRKWARRLFIPVILVFLLLANNAISPLSSIIDKEEVERNLFSGLEGSNNQILVVKIDDTRQARPQIGLEVADIVYVEQVEAGLTRVAAVFSSIASINSASARDPSEPISLITPPANSIDFT